MIRSVVASVATLLSLAGAASAQEGSYQAASVPFTTTTPGSPSGFSFSVDYRNPADPDGKPYSVQEVVVKFHPGTRIDSGVPEQCKASDAEFAMRGAEACPPGSRVGTGRVEFDSGNPVEPRFFHTQVTVFNNQDEFILFNETTDTPGPPLRVAARGKIEGATITTSIPPIPGVPPPDPFLAVRTARETVDAVTRGSGDARRGYVTTPPSCPSSGHWTNTIVFTYRNGVSQTVLTNSPCAATRRGSGKRRSTKLRLSVRPRAATVGRRTRFRFKVSTGGRGVAGAKIRFAGRRLRTNGHGRASLVRTLPRPGSYRAVASRTGFDRDTAKVRASRRGRAVRFVG